MVKFEKSRRQIRRATIGTAGFLILLVGIIAIPYPGPGWAIVFVGLAVLATEFDWAQRILDTLKSKYDAWQDWMKQQSLFVKTIFFTLTAFVVVLTIWLLNGYGILNDLLNLGFDWVDSPIPFFN